MKRLKLFEVKMSKTDRDDVPFIMVAAKGIQEAAHRYKSATIIKYKGEVEVIE